MGSKALAVWASKRAAELDRLEQAHAAMGGVGPGRRHTTQQINDAYCTQLASHFQGFCRDLHSEAVVHVVQTIPQALQAIVQVALTRDRKLDSGNAHPGALGDDFGRLGTSLWSALYSLDPDHRRRNELVELLNKHRNAIAHQRFEPVGGKRVQLAQVRGWRRACGSLARAMDEVVGAHVATLSGASPW